MIDILPPEFHGTEDEQLTQIEEYLSLFSDMLARKFKNIDMTDLNYTLAEMVKKRNKGSLRLKKKTTITRLHRNAVQCDGNYYHSLTGDEPYPELYPKEWAYIQEYQYPNALMSYGSYRITVTENGIYAMRIARRYETGTPKAVFYSGASLRINGGFDGFNIPAENDPDTEIIPAPANAFFMENMSNPPLLWETQFIIIGNLDRDHNWGVDYTAIPWAAYPVSTDPYDWEWDDDNIIERYYDEAENYT